MKHEILHMQYVVHISEKWPLVSRGLPESETEQTISNCIVNTKNKKKKKIYGHVSTPQEKSFKNKRLHLLTLHIGWKTPFQIPTLSPKYLLPANIWTGKIYFVPWQPLQDLWEGLKRVNVLHHLTRPTVATLSQNE